MKLFLLTVTLLTLSNITGLSQQATVAPIPEALKSQFEILNRGYQKFDAKKFPHPPADSVWLCRSASSSAGTLEVAFQGNTVVYMIFRRGVGGLGWTADEAKALHQVYSKELLNEKKIGELYKHFPFNDDQEHSRYSARSGNKAGASTKTNSAIISRKDFDISALTSGL